MTDFTNLEVLPIWSHRVDAATRLRELALLAEKNPERFQKLFVGWIGEKNGKDYSNDISLNMQTAELLGRLLIWQHDVVKRTNREVDSNAEQKQEASPPDGGSGPRSVLCFPSGGTAESSEGVQSGGQEDGNPQEGGT